MEPFLHSFPKVVNTLQIVGCHFGLQPTGWHFPRHHHHLYELLYCMEGEVIQELNRETVTVRQGDWLLIKSGVRHQSTNTSAALFGYFNVHFDLDDADLRSLLGASAYRHIPAHVAGQSQLQHYVGELEAMMRRSREQIARTPDPQQLTLRFEDKLLLQSYTLLIIHGVLALLRTQADTDSPRPATTPVPSKDATLFAADAAHAIEEQLSLGLCEEASVAGVAKQLNLSRSQCSKLFSKVYGLSPRQYVSRQKLNLAKELLVTTNLPMAEIAEKLGFHSASHFSRQFRRWTGQSPSDFRPKHFI
ncbi:AraC family transcriptional regulator [Paenibacillus cremeus]|uniref:Helix-turn-helix domain-containing protein n=1 Tax=Paenibacillus cremeus TaxID=2163881 RepID=A0A559KI54_9BACL|nr:AraC family transcriptional regulator [Paenibacillus cremeus]TVY11802.1 helix-turn-helix domain-containing protein [Paenibacillus cremeus]